MNSQLCLKPFKAAVRGLVLGLLVLFSATLIRAQNPTATIRGTVHDTAGAVIQHATVELKNANSGDTRTVLTNDSGLFTFPAIPSGDYNIIVSASGFANFVEKGYHVDPGDTRALSNIVLGVGSTNEAVVVTADAERIDTTSGETSSLITAGDIEHLAVEGRDVTELLKILPGFAIANQPGPSRITNSAYDPGVVSPGGAIGSYSADGTPISGTVLKWDGTNLTDPGAQAGALQNVNYDMVSEVKAQVGSFTAEESNGPVVINAVTKAGGQQYHGALYTYARTSQLNSTDWLAATLGYTKPPDRYVYPGLFIGGPIKIPGTRFARSKRATFFAGFEDYAQRNTYAYGSASNAIIHALVPTDNMKKGDFSASEIAQYLGPSINNSTYQNLQSVPTVDKYNNPVINGNIAATLDPGATVLFSRLPSPNMPSNGSYNYLAQNLVADDMWQAVGRVDFAFSDKYKLFARYSTEQGLSYQPQAPFYSPSSATMGGVNTPGGGLVTTTNAQSATVNLTMILSPTTTNMVAASLTYSNYQLKPKNKASLEGSTYSYPYQGAYQTSGSLELPQFADYNPDGMPLLLVPDFSNGNIYTKKMLPNVSDDFTKLLGKHELKAGIYLEQVTNNQRQMNVATPSNGAVASYYYTPTHCGWAPYCSLTDLDGTTYWPSENYLANEMEGLFGSWSQENFTPGTDLFYWNIDGYVTDSWKVRESLVVNFGVRFEHLGTWDDRHGLGIAIFSPSTLNQTASDTLPLPGFAWHSIDPSVPVSGVKSRGAFVEPRLGFSWNITGKGKTVLRGGYGQYRYHDSWNDVSNAAQSSQGVRAVNAISGSGGLSLEGISKQQLSSTSGTLSLNVAGLDPNDNNQAMTQTYTLAIDRALPYRTQLEIAYIGNHTSHLFNAGDQSGSGATLDNVNVVPYGGLYTPIDGAIPTPYTIANMNTATINAYRKYGTNPYDPASKQLITSPYQSVNNYGIITVPHHVAYSNFNGLQFALQRQTGRLRYGSNPKGRSPSSAGETAGV